MKKQTDKKLKLSKETMRRLTGEELGRAVAGDDLTCASDCITSCPECDVDGLRGF